MTTNRTVRITLAILVVVLLAVMAAIFQMSRELNSCDSYAGFCMNLEKDYASATLTTEAQ